MVTWEALARIGVGILGAGIAGFGVLRWFAAGMATHPDAEERKKGCAGLLLGLVIVVAAIIG